ncbi:MAG: hypothetical protein NT154_38700 [Verrucomicrobia bacterium]|nr:hypothetical protein [Verrucomicrobiota bacterium]
MPKPNIVQAAANPLYGQARQLLQAAPGIGKGKLAKSLGIKTPTARRLIERYRGETQGHNTAHPDYVRVLQLKQQHPDWGAVKVAQALGMTLDHAKLHLARWVGAQSYPGGATAPAVPASSPPSPLPSTPASPETPNSRDNELQDNVHDGERDLSYRGTRIQTLSQLLQFADVDSGEWELERHTLNKYEVAAKTPDGMTTTMLFQIKAWLRRRVAEQKFQNLLEGMLERFKQAAPLRPALPRRPAKGLLEISLMDHHFGKLCSAEETGYRAYDPEIAERMFIAAVNDLLQKAAHLPVEKILMVCGNDYLNTDHLGRTTTAGTPQDEALRYPESFSRSRELLIRAIDRLYEIAPVRVVMVTGNHDQQRLYYLGSALDAWYRNTEDVEVDNSPRQRKYFQYYKNLIGFTHGHNEKHFDLPLLLATENPEGWAVTRHREFHLGHFHSRKHKMFVPSFDRAGVLVRLLPSLCPPDAWHAAMGYSSKLAAEALYYDPEEGCVANFSHSPP